VAKDKDRQQQLDRIVHPFMLRRTKEKVLDELPEKTEIYQTVNLSPEEMAVYEIIRERAQKMLESEDSDKVSVNALAEITRLRQASCSAQLVEKNWKGKSSKIEALIEALEPIIESGDSALVFSQFTSFLALVRQCLDKQKQPYLYLDGSVPVRQRDQLVQQFQHGDCPVFLISLKAGGLGLNLTGANYVIHLDPWWNPAIEQQATDRAYRLGQRQNVTVYHLISQHTIEEKILRLHQTKRNLADAMLEGTSESHKLTSKDLLAMLDQQDA
jgi:SNF2 family DNA or RNA helicase